MTTVQNATVSNELLAAVNPAKSVSKSGANPNFGMNMPLMSSAFDTAMWLSAA